MSEKSACGAIAIISGIFVSVVLIYIALLWAGSAHGGWTVLLPASLLTLLGAPAGFKSACGDALLSFIVAVFIAFL